LPNPDKNSRRELKTETGKDYAPVKKERKNNAAAPPGSVRAMF
jgi:hypothetical protein